METNYILGIGKTYSIWRLSPWSLFRTVFKICKIAKNQPFDPKKDIYTLTTNVMAQLVSQSDSVSASKYQLVVLLSMS